MSDVAASILVVLVFGLVASAWSTYDDYLRRRRTRKKQELWLERQREEEAMAIRARVRMMECNREVIDAQTDAALRTIKASRDEPHEPWRNSSP